MKLVCDTNVWYDLAAGRRDLNALTRQGHELMATAINLLEIVSKVNANNFAERNGAAASMLAHATEFLDVPDYFIGRECGLAIPNLPFTWRQVCQTIAEARNASEITNGVSDYQAQVSRRIDVPGLKSWRTYIYDKWEEDIVNAIGSEFPHYLLARALGRAKYMKKAEATKLLARLTSPGAQLQIIETVVARISKEATSVPSPLASQMGAYIDSLAPYARAYAFYLHMVASMKTPEPNDRGDIDAFLYLNLKSDRRLLTHEDKWIELAERAGLDTLLLDPEVV